MFKILSILGQATVAIGMMAAMPRITASMQAKMEDTSKLIDAMAALGGNSTMLKVKPGTHDLTGGKGLNLDSTTSLPNLMGFLNGKTVDATQPAPPPVPTRPMTVIRYTCGDRNRGKSAKIGVTKLPTGANATVVDGHVQIYYPSRKSKTAK